MSITIASAPTGAFPPPSTFAVLTPQLFVVPLASANVAALNVVITTPTSSHPIPPAAAAPPLAHRHHHQQQQQHNQHHRTFSLLVIPPFAMRGSLLCNVSRHRALII